MFILLMIVVMVAVGFLIASAAREPGAPRRVVSAAALRVAAGIALVRIIVFYACIALLGYPDWRQVFGYLLLILNCGIELGVATALYGQRPGPPPFVVPVLIGLTSVLLGFGWAWLRSRRRSVNGQRRAG